LAHQPLPRDLFLGGSAELTATKLQTWLTCGDLENLNVLLYYINGASLHCHDTGPIVPQVLSSNTNQI